MNEGHVGVSGRTLPHNLEAEKSVLGAILINNTSFNQAGVVDSRDFFRDAHRRIWEKMVALVGRSEPVDLVTLKDELTRSGELDEVGGPAYISALTDGVPRSANVEYYAKIVKEKSTLRRIIQASNDVIVRAYDAEEDADNLLDEAARTLSRIADNCCRADATDPFRSAQEIATSTTRPAWIVPGLIAAGALTELSGAAKLAGKTTFLAAAIRQVLTDGSFLGHKVQRTPVVYLTEQPDATFAEVLRRSGLTHRTNDLAVLSRWSVRTRPWPAIVSLARKKASEIGASLVIVDTLPKFTAIKGDGENNSGDALTSLEPLEELTSQGIAVVVVRHDRKGGGEVGESARGSTAFTGAMDICLRLKRPPGRQQTAYRVLEGIGRFEETPAHLVIEKVSARCPELDADVWADSFRAVGTVDAVATDTARTGIEAHLPTSAGDGLTLKELQALTGSTRQATQRAINTIQGIGKTGAGRRGDAFRYYRTQAGEEILLKPQSQGLPS